MGWSYHNKPPMGWPLDYDSGLVPNAGFWLFNEGSGNKVFDLSGRSTGTEQVDSVWYPGKYGPVRYFSGDDYINCGNNNVLGFGGDVEFTIIIRGLATDTGNQQTLLDRQSPVNPWPGYQVYIKWDDIYVLLDDGADSITVSTASNCLSDNTWFDIALVARNGSLKYYVDGIDLDEDDDISSIDTVVASANFIIGATQGGAVNLIGQIDFVMVYGSVKSASEIAQLYREPFCMFKDPDEIPVFDQFYSVGNAGIMTPNTGYWGPTF